MYITNELTRPERTPSNVEGVVEGSGGAGVSVQSTLSKNKFGHFITHHTPIITSTINPQSHFKSTGMGGGPS